MGRQEAAVTAASILDPKGHTQGAPILARELAPAFEPEDLISLPNYNIYLRLMIQGEVSRPFSASTVPQGVELDPAPSSMAH